MKKRKWERVKNGSRLVETVVLGDVRKLKRGWSGRIGDAKKRFRAKSQREARSMVELGEVRAVQPATKPSPQRARAKMAEQQAPERLESFARRVQSAANELPPWTPGADGVPISDIYHRLRPRPPLEEFRRLLIQAHQADLLELTRADLVEAMDPKTVRDSEVTHFGARFHFVTKTRR